MVLAATLAACGGGAVLLPPDQVAFNGVYEGSIAGVEGPVSARLVLGEVFSDGSLAAELSYPDDPQVAPVSGTGTVWGTSFSIVLERFSRDAFYVEGHLETETRRLVGTVRYPDHEQSLNFIFFYVGSAG